nr:transposase [Janthinobacterium sp. NKUCC06_STL]
MGRASTPSAVVIHAQSTRISPQGGASGFDAGKKVKGRKRHLVVDTMGLVIAVSVSVTAASVQDRDAAAAVVTQACSMSPHQDKLYTDRAYGGKCALAIEQAHHIRVAVVRHPGNGTTGTLYDAETTPEFSALEKLADWQWQLPRDRGAGRRWILDRLHFRYLQGRELDASGVHIGT